VSAPLRPGPASGEPSDAGPDAASGIAIGFALAGWVLYALLGPVAVFLTWWGDCDVDPCAVPGAIDQAAYTFDVLWWLAFPILAYFAYGGRRWAWAALLAIAVVLDLQLLAAIAGGRGFSGFAVTLPSAALMTFGAGLGLAMLVPRFRDRPGSSAAGQVAAIGCLAVVAAVVAVQGFLLNLGGPIVWIAAVVAVALVVIAIAAFVNRDAGAAARRRARRGP
jgi:hypothetical protein